MAIKSKPTTPDYKKGFNDGGLAVLVQILNALQDAIKAEPKNHTITAAEALNRFRMILVLQVEEMVKSDPDPTDEDLRVIKSN